MFSYRDLKFIFDLFRYKIQGRRFPAHVAIAVTNRCNLKCSYCFARHSADGEDRITTERIFSLVDELHRKGTRLINLTGGEPLLKKDIKAIIDYITIKKGIRCSLSTNALLLEDKIESLKNINSINISLDGNEEQHNRNRGLQNYKRIIRAIEIAIENKIPVSTCTVLNKTNMDCVDSIVGLAKKKGFLAIFQIPYGRLKPEENKNYEPIDFEEMPKLMQKIIDYKNAGYPVYYSNKTHAYIRDWPCIHSSRTLQKQDIPDKKKFKIIPCFAGDTYCLIDSKGDVYPCAVLSGQVKALNFIETGFEAAWNFLPGIRCRACSFCFQTELNLLFSLCPSVWKNFITLSDIF